ncbi:MAG TPA: fimbria/pilus outer membrane usher protein [Allosphingosinicella sp.]|nr:fimbria/pilus outer membrane usher protein [Allosphingosinicella sp.]
MARPRRLPITFRLGLLLSLLFGPAAAAADVVGANGAETEAAATATAGPADIAVALALTPALLDVTVNGQAGDEPVQFLRDRAGRIYISGAFLRAWRIRAPTTVPVRVEGEAYYLAAAMPALRLTVAEAAQSIAIEADPGAFEGQSAALDETEAVAMTPPAIGAFLNYDVFADHYRGKTNLNGLFEVGVFTAGGAGTASFLASAGGGRTQVTRLETTWTIDRPNRMTSIRIGDSISSAGPGAAPVRFAGVQYARNFAVQPGYITMPLPAVGGSAAVPSVVDVYVNSALQAQQQVSPGPFELRNVPVPSGGGQVRLVMRDLLGREIVSEQSYYASAQLLRAGLHDFSYEAGFLREAFGRRSNQYGEFFASTTHRYGISDRITGEATAQASKNTQMVGIAINAIVFDLAQAGGSVALSHSRDRMGFRAAASFERHANSFSLGLRADYTSAHYAAVGFPADRPPPRYTVQAFADMPLPRGGIGVNFLYRSLRGEDDETLAGIFASWQVRPNIGVQFYARHSIVGTRQTSIGAHLAVSFGGRRSASLSVDREHGRSAAYLSYQDDPPPGPGDGFRVMARLGEDEAADATYVRNISAATLTAQATYARGAPGLRLSARGSIGLMGGRVFASRSLGESFAAVRLDGYPGVHVFADNQPVGVTDKSGFLIVPGLRAFDRNTIRIEEGDLPLDVSLASNEIQVRPFARAGTAIRFAARRERGVLMHVRLEDGRDLPAGAQVRAEGAAETFVAVSGGEVYAPNLTGVVRMRASWGTKTCEFTAAVPAGDDLQPRLDNLVCREEPHYAAS